MAKTTTAFTVADVLKSKTAPGLVISVDQDTSVSRTLQLMNERNIRAAPLTNKQGQFVAILNLFDLVCGIALPMANPVDFEGFASEETQLATRKRRESNTLTANWFLGRLTQDLFAGSISDLSGLSYEGAHPCIVNLDDSLFELAAALSSGTHHALVRGAGSTSSTPSSVHNVAGIISQSDVVRFIVEHSSHFPVLHRSVAECNLHIRDMVVADVGSIALSAFRSMYKSSRELRALPVVDHSGHLMDSVSASDLRGLTAYTAATLLLPLPFFLNLIPGRPTAHFHLNARQATAQQEALPADRNPKRNKTEGGGDSTMAAPPESTTRTPPPSPATPSDLYRAQTAPTLQTIPSQSAASPCTCHCDASASLLSLAKVMVGLDCEDEPAREGPRVCRRRSAVRHRVWVLNDVQKPVGAVSQTDILRLVAASVSKLQASPATTAELTTARPATTA